MLDIDLHINIDMKILYNLVSTEKKTGVNVNVSCFIVSIIIKKMIFLNGRWLGEQFRWLGGAQPCPTLDTPLLETEFVIVPVIF